MKCIRCDTEMRFHSRINVKSPSQYSGFYFEIDPKPVSLSKFSIDLYICPNCQKTEFFMVEEPPSVSTILCPHCQNTVSIITAESTQCPICGKDIYEPVKNRTYIKPKGF